MKKQLTRMFQTKVPALVTIDIQSVDVQVLQHSTLTVSWKRGPQLDEAPTFEVDPSETEYKVSH